MTTITVQIDPNTAERVRQVAQARHTTLERLIGDYLDHLATSPGASPTAPAQVLLETIRALSRPMGGKPWNLRDELHER